MPNPSVGTLAARTLPAKPNLEHLKNEAKQRLDLLRLATPGAKLAEAQHQLAREYGFSNWRDLKADIERRASGPISPAARAALGDWICDLSAGRGRMALHIGAGEGGGLGATMDTPDFGFFGMAADDVVVEGDRLSFVLLAPLVVGFHQGYYEARWEAERDRWIGEWTAHGITASLDFVRGVYPPGPRYEGLDGFWDGRLMTDDGLIRLIFRFKTDANGTFAWLDSPDRNLLGRPAVSVVRDGRQVTVAMQTVTVNGELSEDGAWLEGRFIKGDTERPLTLIHRPPGAAAPLPQRAPAIELATEVLAKYAGRYEADGGLILTASLEDGGLKIQFPGGQVRGAAGVARVQLHGGPKLDLLASAPSKFFLRVLDVTVEFETDAQGHVTGLVMRQTGLETRARRLG